MLDFEPRPVLETKPHVPIKKLIVRNNLVRIMNPPNTQILFEYIEVLLFEVHNADLFLCVAVSGLSEFGIVLVQRDPLFEAPRLLLFFMDFGDHKEFGFEVPFLNHFLF